MIRARLAGRGARFWLLAVAVLCFALGAAGPSLRVQRTVGTYMMAFDISQSMNVRDVDHAGAKVSRLDFARSLATGALDRLPCGTHVGVSVFVERKTQPLLMPVEICAHRAALADSISHLDWRMAWAADSHLYYGTYSALDDIRTLAPGAALAFFTDGHQAPALHAGRAPAYGAAPGEVPGVLFGVGGELPEPVPKLGDKGRIDGYWTPADTAGFASAGAPTLSVADMERLGGDLRNAPQRPAGAGDDHLSRRHDDVLDEVAKITGLQTAVARSPMQVATLLRALPGGHVADTLFSLRPPLALAGLIALLASLAPAGLLRPARLRHAWQRLPALFNFRST